MVLDLMAQLDREFTERNKIEALLRELLDAKRNRKSEQLSADQLALFAELLQARQVQAESPVKRGDSDDDAAGGGTGEATPKKRPGGRQPLSKNLLRERIVHDRAEEEKHCASCQKDLRPIGEETSERYEYIPAQLKVVEDVCKKYACDCTVKTATKPPQPIEKSTAGASLLAQVTWPRPPTTCLCTGRRRFSSVTVPISPARPCAAGWRNAAICSGLCMERPKRFYFNPRPSVPTIPA